LQADGADIELIEVRDSGASVRLSGLTVCAAGPANSHTELVELLKARIDLRRLPRSRARNGHIKVLLETPHS
jgi:hypothetical protein